AEPRTWRTLLLLDLETHPPRDAIQAVTLRAEPTPARTVQFSLLDPAQPSPERLAETMARLHEGTAAGRGGAPVPPDTHRPGPAAPRGSGGRGGGAASSGTSRWKPACTGSSAICCKTRGLLKVSSINGYAAGRGEAASSVFPPRPSPRASKASRLTTPGP